LIMLSSNVDATSTSSNNVALAVIVNTYSNGNETNCPFQLPCQLVDPYALSVVTYLQFCQLPYHLVHSNRSYMCNTFLQTKSFHHATTPILNRDNKQVAQGPIQCLNYLKTHGVNLDEYLSIPETSSSTLQQIQNEIEIFTVLMNEKLLPLFIWQMWGFGNYEDYVNLIWNGWFNKKNWLTKWMFVPLSRRRFGDWLRTLNVEKNALECLDALSVLLGDKKYFYGTQPSTLDAIVYGYLASFKMISFQSTTARMMISRFTNLDAFVDTVTNEYFSTTALKLTRPREFVLKEDRFRLSEPAAPVAKYTNSRKNLYLALALSSIAAYILYLFRGIIFAPKVVYVVLDEDNEDEVYYDNQEEEHGEPTLPEEEE
jgi:hypothetical protein